MKTMSRLSAIILAVLIISSPVFADITLKVRTTMEGNKFESSTFIKGKRERTEQDFGGMKMVTIRQCDLRRSVRLNPMTEMYIIENWATNDALTQTVDTSSDAPSTTVVKRKGGLVTITITMRDTGERKKMFGYNARRVIVTTEMKSSADSCGGEEYTKMETDGWYIDAEFPFDCGDNLPVDFPTNRQRNAPECRDRQKVNTVGGGKLGYPLYEKMTMFDRAGKPSFTMIKEVYELSMATLDPALFDIPKGWKLANSENEMMMGGNMLDPDAIGGANNSDEDDAESDQDGVEDRKQAGSPSTSSGPAGGAPVGGIVKASAAGPKKPGTIRIGLAGVKTGSVGDGMSPELLANAIHKLFGDYFKGTGIELVFIEAKLQSAMENEARGNACDFLLMATVSHKRGGGGFGALRSIGSAIGRNIPYGGSVVEQVGSEVAREAIYDASQAAGGVKSKDELTLDVVLRKLDGSSALTRQFKSKASSEQEDIMSPAVEKATEAILSFVSK